MSQRLTWEKLGILLTQAQRGDDESREQLFALLRAKLLIIARYRVQEAAEDMIQETLIIVHNRLSEFETPDGLLAFTHQVLRNKIGNVYQERNRHKQRQVDLKQVAEPQYHITDELEAGELERIMRKCIDKLGEQRPRCGAILSCLYNGFDVGEISEALGITKSMLKVQTFRCRETLRTLLALEYGWEL